MAKTGNHTDRHGTRLVKNLNMAKLAVFGLFCSSKIVFAQDATTEAATEEPTQPFFAEFNRQALLFSNGCFCQHGASCDAQNCLCINFYTGTNCQNAPSCSSSNPCLNGGSCMDTEWFLLKFWILGVKLRDSVKNGDLWLFLGSNNSNMC